MTANEITSTLLVEISRRHSGRIICWRNNTGRGYGLSDVRAAIAMLRNRNIDGALQRLRRPLDFGLVGSADILLVAGPNGRTGGIEVKAGDDQQSPEQEAWERRIIELGGFYIIARTVEQALADLAKEIE